MSKTRKIIVALCAVMAVLLTAAAWLSGLFPFVHADGAEKGPDGSAANLQLLDVGMCTDSGSEEKVSFTINRNLGGDPFPVVSPAADKVVYTQAAGGTRTLSGVYYKLDLGKAEKGVVATLVFSFAEDTVADGKVVYGEGDTLTIKSGFSFSNWNGSDLGIQYVSDVTVTYLNGEWTGVFPDLQLTGLSASVGTIVVSNVTIIDFNLTNPTGLDAFVDQDTGWYTSGWGDQAKYVYQDVSPYVTYFISEDTPAYSRILYGAGKFGVERKSAAAPKAGEYILLKKGFVLYDVLSYTYEEGIGKLALGANHYRPVLVLHRDIAFVFDGTSWVESVPADSAEFTNSAEEKASLAVNTVLPLTWKISEGATEPMPTFTSSNPDVATVSAAGEVLGKSEGSVTITAKFLGVSASVDLTVGAEPAKESLSVRVTNGSTRETSDGGTAQYIVAYRGETLSAARAAECLTAKYHYANGLSGEEFDVTEDMIGFGSFSSAEAGETSVTVTSGGLSADAPVWVYNVITVDPLAPERIVTWGPAMDLYFVDTISDNTGSVVSVDLRDKTTYGVPRDMVKMRTANTDSNQKSYTIHSIGQVNHQQQLLFFEGFDGTDVAGSLSVGVVLEFQESYRFYQWIDDYWVAAYKFAGEVRYVWTGSAWTNYVADAEDFTVEQTEYADMPVGVRLPLNISCIPQGTYANVSYSSSDETVAEVSAQGILVAKAAGTATITVTMGTVNKEIKVTVVEAGAQGIALANNRTFYVAENGAFDVTKVRVKKDLGNGYYGEEIALTAETASFSLDTSIAGKTQLEITIDDEANGLHGTVTVQIDVQESKEIYPDNILCADDNTFFGDAIAIYFQKTFPNTANVVPDKLTAEEKASIVDNIEFLRDGTPVTIKNPNYLTFILSFVPEVSGENIHTYQRGDTILLKKGLAFYVWFGDIDNNNVPVGEGDYVKVGELKYDVTFTYNSNGKFFMEIAPVSGVAKQETVEVGLNAQYASNVAIVPEYATSGEWFFSSADESIAVVNANGLITGKSIGQTTVTAILKKSDGTEISTVTFTVKVLDVVQSLKITSESPVRLDVGAELIVSDLVEKFGIKGVKLMASGEEGGLVDLSNARVTGYDPDLTGEQTLTFRVTVDGKSVTGTLTISVGTESTGGCGSCAASVSSAWALLAFAAVFVIGRRKSV